MQSLFEKLKACEGKIGFFYAGLDDNVTLTYNPDLELSAASVIKIPIMIEAFRQFEAGMIDPNALYTLKEEDKKPSCGALNRMHAGLQVTVRDLVELMIVLSDNSATNIMIDMLGIENINATMNRFGCEKTVVRRKLWDLEKSRMGIINTISAGEIGNLLIKLYRHELISEASDTIMLEILSNQKLNGKFPFFLKPNGIRCAHKTGEDDGITHDAGIIFTKHPFVLCMFSNETNVPKFERLMQDTAWALAQINE